MISLRLLLFFITLWHFSHASNNALFFNWKEQQLVEISKFDDKAVCRSCISVCPTISGSVEEKLLNDRVSVTKNSNFLRHVYPVVAPAGKIQIDVCENTFSPGLVWDTKAKSFDVGYEMYYEERRVDLQYMYYDNYVKVIDGKPNLKPKDYPSPDEIKIYRGDETVKFEIVDQPENKFYFFYFIDVLSFDVSEDGKQRTVSFIKDTINDYRHQDCTISYCKTYFSGDNTQEIGEEQQTNVIDHVKNSQPDTKILAEKPETNSEQSVPPANRLVKTQILPMRMFHTLAARLSTCMYLNIAFVWETIAETQLKKIDLFLYALYRLFPIGIKLVFGVSGDLQEIDPIISKKIASEHHLFTKFPVPKVICRFVDYGVAGKLYGAVVIIHNNVESVQDEDRICPANEEVEGWGDIRNRNAANGYSYTCKQTPQVFKKLGLDENAAPINMIPLKLNSFPYTRVKNGPIEFKSAFNRIDLMLNFIKELNIEY